MTSRSKRGVSDVRQDNALAMPPPAIVERAPDVRSKKVGKSGAVHLAGLAEGTNVNVAMLDEDTYLVSSRPADELLALTARLPSEPVSPFAALAASMGARKHDRKTPRIRTVHPTSEHRFEPTEDDYVGLDLERSERRR